MGALRCVSLRASGVGRAPAPSPRKGCSGSPLSVFGGFPRPAPCGRGCGRCAPLAHWSPPWGRVSGCRLGSLWGRLCRIPRPVPAGAVFMLAPLALAPPRGSPLRSRSGCAQTLSSLSSSALLAPAGAPRCALPALAPAGRVLAPCGCALPPRVGVPCLPAVGIPDARLECKGGFAVLGGSSSGAYPSPPSGARVYAGLLWYLLGLPPQTLLFEVARWRARLKWY